MIQAKLKLKIMAGYLVLISCLGFIICFVHEEWEKKSVMEWQELRWQGERGLTNRTFIGLLDLTATGELVAGWTKEDYDAYCKKRMEVTALLQELKLKQENTEQQNCIDSVCSLLEEKERQMAAILGLLESMPDAGEMVRRKIPAIVWQTQERTSPLAASSADPPITEKKKKNIWSFLKKKEEKSAYARQREKAKNDEKKQAVGTNRTLSPTLLYSLEKEISDTTRLYEERLSAGIDSLRMQNRRLNGRMNVLIQNFEQKETETFCREIQVQQAVRNRFFRLIAGSSFGAFALVILLYIIVHRDVNRRYHYRKELEASNRKNTELLTARKNMMLSIAHDLRAPLAAIKGCAELLPGEEEKSRKDEYAENILHSSDYMVGLVNTLIEFYLLDTGRNKPSLSIFRLETLFSETARNYGMLAKKKQLRLTTGFSGLDVVVSGDRSQLRQILHNLLSNAIKFTRQGEIRLQAEYRDKELHFSVQDTGTGMAEEEKSRIFTAFERLDNARDIPGFGLGLAIASRLVSGMQGTLAVESKPGEGSTFIVFLPFPKADGSARIDAARVATDYHLDDIRVLVIDDDLMQLNITREMFHRNGIRCDCCQTSRELITRLRSQRYDLLLTDLQMPETDGYGILELLRASNMENAKTIPVMAVTARVDDGSEYLSAGFSGCIHKPFSMDELLKAVAEVVGEKAPRKHEPDFSLILAGEDNKKEMLGLFIEESRKDLAVLTGALDRKDKAAAASVLHKNLPLWETIRLDFPLSRLRKLVTDSAEEWADGQFMEIREIVRAVEKLITYAEKIREESL